MFDCHSNQEWSIYSQYVLQDGIYPTTAGSIAADVIWAEMQKNNIFGTDTPTSKIGDVNADNNIDALDFALMKQYLLGIVTDFPANATAFLVFKVTR